MTEHPKLGRVFTPSQLAAYEAGREDAAADIERLLMNDRAQEIVQHIPRNLWVVNFDAAIRQARGMHS